LHQLRFVASIGAIVLVCASGADAQYRRAMFSQNFAPDPRALGMGTAFTALAQGPSAAYWNPAGLGIGPDPLSIAVQPVSWVRVIPDFSDSRVYSACAAVETRGLGFGVNLNHLSLGGDYAEYTMHVGAGIDLARTLLSHPRALGADWSLGAGANLKVFDIDYALPIFVDPLVREDTAYDMDLGTLLVARWQGADTTPSQPPTWFATGRLGAVVSNVADGTIGGAIGLPFEPGALGRSVRFGVAAEAGTARLGSLGPALQARASFEVVTFWGRFTHKPAYLHGVEVVALDILSVRAGYENIENFEETTVGFGVGTPIKGLWGARVDAAGLPSEDGDSRNQYSLMFWYGSPYAPGGW
jgi:hypothetical protein